MPFTNYIENCNITAHYISQLHISITTCLLNIAPEENLSSIQQYSFLLDHFVEGGHLTKCAKQKDNFSFLVGVYLLNKKQS